MLSKLINFSVPKFSHLYIFKKIVTTSQDCWGFHVKCVKHRMSAQSTYLKIGTCVLKWTWKGKWAIRVPDPETWSTSIRLPWSLHSRSPRIIIPLLEKTQIVSSSLVRDSKFRQNSACFPAISLVTDVKYTLSWGFCEKIYTDLVRYKSQCKGKLWFFLDINALLQA